MIQRQLPLYRIDAIKDEPLPTSIEGLKPHADYAGRILGQCPAYFAGETNQLTISFNGEVPENPDSNVYISQLSPIHARSFEVIDDERPEIWQDEFGHSYSSVNLKGNNFSDARLIESPTASEGLIAYGLQESAAIRRIIRGSNILRSLGVSTEFIIGVGEPEYYPVPTAGHDVDWHENLSKDEYKQLIISKYWLTLPEGQRTPESLAELHNKFSRITFYITLRAMDTSYRFSEMHNSDARKRVFDIANKLGYIQGEPLDAENPKDLDRLMTEVTIPKLAENIYKMHKAGLAHRFPHGGNITALGSIIDLDSLHGEALGLGDEPITIKDILTDLEYVILAFNEKNIISFSYDEFSSKYIDLFLALYAEHFRRDEQKPSFTLYDIAILADPENVENEDLWEQWFLQTARRHIRYVFKDEIEDEKTELVMSSMDLWTDNLADEDAEEIITFAEELLEPFRDLLIHEAFIEGGTLDNILDDFLASSKKYKITSENFYERINDTVIKKFISDKVSVGVEEFDNLTDEQKTNLLYIWKTPENFLMKLYDKFFQKYREKLNEMLIPDITESIIPGTYSEIAHYISGNKFSINSLGVEIGDLISACSDRNIDIHVAKYEDPLSEEHRRKILSGEIHDTHTAAEGFSIVEVITDGEITLSSYPVEIELSSLYIELSEESRYVAFVEQNDKGEKKVVLQIVTSEDVENQINWDEIGDLDIALSIVNNYIRQGKLFDDRPYIHRQERFEFSVSVN